MLRVTETRHRLQVSKAPLGNGAEDLPDARPRPSICRNGISARRTARVCLWLAGTQARSSRQPCSCGVKHRARQ